MKGKALRRALETTDAIRIGTNLPLITDSTELITPEKAQEMLQRNKNNRPVNWKRVETYADVMAKGDWKLHSQGIILDGDENILTGQNRLWGIIYSGTSVYMRISRGNTKDVARLLDRGTPQSSRDLATRDTQRRHSPNEASIVRAICAMNGNLKPSADVLANALVANTKKLEIVLAETNRTRKTKSVIMILAAMCNQIQNEEELRELAKQSVRFANHLDAALQPETANRCWGKGAAFGLAMEHARKCVSRCN